MLVVLRIWKCIGENRVPVFGFSGVPVFVLINTLPTINYQLSNINCINHFYIFIHLNELIGWGRMLTRVQNVKEKGHRSYISDESHRKKYLLLIKEYYE